MDTNSKDCCSLCGGRLSGDGEHPPCPRCSDLLYLCSSVCNVCGYAGEIVIRERSEAELLRIREQLQARLNAVLTERGTLRQQIIAIDVLLLAERREAAH